MDTKRLLTTDERIHETRRLIRQRLRARLEHGPASIGRHLVREEIRSFCWILRLLHRKLWAERELSDIARRN